MDYRALHHRAHAAGVAAGEGHTPRPMHIMGYEIADGVCGFAWVTVRPGTDPFARWLRTNAGTHRGYHGGEELWVSGFGQSYERKMAFARAYAKTLGEAGISAHAGGRLD